MHHTVRARWTYSGGTGERDGKQMIGTKQKGDTDSRRGPILPVISRRAREFVVQRLGDPSLKSFFWFRRLSLHCRTVDQVNEPCTHLGTRTRDDERTSCSRGSVRVRFTSTALLPMGCPEYERNALLVDGVMIAGTQPVFALFAEPP
ncbi:unnamed protein product [Scytosiphon promiscuus]